MREYRMGLIQTPDQLRFSYMAVIEGAKLIPPPNKPKRMSRSDLEPELTPPPPPPTPPPTPPPPTPPTPPLPHLSDSTPNGQPAPRLEPGAAAGGQLSAGGPDGDAAEDSGLVRRRHREERIACTSQKLQQMKQRLSQSERKRDQWLYWRPILLNVGAGAAVAVGLLVCWIYAQ
ncbi:Tyrosine-protein phosphatase non-receptor type 2 [Liparis tanakae]|uniref:protein-tyrosine-phosphatase n=1 Tax=Liparis tanakae TaxID=230148 RepID=A0A4Z2FDD8_9TELE|nr:Tyrosine-protein phosphatase non-receptor type 2 [Liparis tanakae]